MALEAGGTNGISHNCSRPAVRVSAGVGSRTHLPCISLYNQNCRQGRPVKISGRLLTFTHKPALATVNIAGVLVVTIDLNATHRN